MPEYPIIRLSDRREANYGQEAESTEHGPTLRMRGSSQNEFTGNGPPDQPTNNMSQTCEEYHLANPAVPDIELSRLRRGEHRIQRDSWIMVPTFSYPTPSKNPTILFFAPRAKIKGNWPTAIEPALLGMNVGTKFR